AARLSLREPALPRSHPCPRPRDALRGDGRASPRAAPVDSLRTAAPLALHARARARSCVDRRTRSAPLLSRLLREPCCMNRNPSSFLANCARGCVDARTGNRYVLAARDIRRGERIAVFGGSVLTRTDLEGLGEGTGRYTLQIDEDLYLVST